MADQQYDQHRIQIMRNAYRKLDNLPLGFGIQAYSDTITDEVVEKLFGIDMDDALRESRLTIDVIESGTVTEMQIENRVVYNALRRFRLSASVFFKFSTAVDGKTVDKTSIPKMLTSIINEYDAEYRSWRSGSVGNIWNRGGK